MADKFRSTLLVPESADVTPEGVNKGLLDLLKKVNAVFDERYPVGSIFVQYPGQEAPADLLGGAWLNISSLYEGAFFRAEGGLALAFEAGIQTDAFQGHNHNVPVIGNVVAGSGSFLAGANNNTNSNNGVGSPVTDGSSGTPRTAAETRPTNYTVRIWKRSG